MCGIAFQYSETGPLEGLSKMTLALNLMRHRGPDDAGIVDAAGALLGHRRLSIIDVAGSRQPMQDSTGRFTITYNGEIYNYKEIKKLFTGRWEYNTDGDTELLLSGLILEGVKFLERLEGMWAFCLWDSQKKELLFARDRFGKKPLYYKSDQGTISIASELRALRALCVTSEWNEDTNAIINYFRYGFCLPGETFYSGVNEVLPGHYAKWRSGRMIDSGKYNDSVQQPFSGSFNDACESIRASFLESVRRRLVSDVEVGAFLSGGIDSSLVVAAIRRVNSGRLKTFTIGFADPGYDERVHARTIAQRYSTDHYEEVLEDFNSDDLARLVLDHVGQPFADASLLPTAMVAALAARHVKVVLSGDGSDELFAGYQRYSGRVLADWYRKFPDILLKLVEQFLRSIPEPRVHHSHSLIKKSHLFLDMIQAQEAVYVGPRMLAEQEVASLLGELGVASTHVTLSEQLLSDSVTKLMMADQAVYLPQDILTKVDRASMAYSLEARAPFLDKAVVDLARSLPLSFHMRMLKGKYLLREAFKEWIPDSIWSRRKHGFAVPLGSWFLGKLGNELESRIGGGDHPLDRSFVLNRLAMHRERKRDFGQVLWAVYVYLLWRESHVKLA